MTTYVPGAVAVATVRGVPNVRVWRSQATTWLDEVDVTDARPLVVIDPADNPWSPGTAEWIDWIEAQYVEQTRPPKPPEPTEFGAKVRDREGRVWLRFTSNPTRRHPWAAEDRPWFHTTPRLTPWRSSHE